MRNFFKHYGLLTLGVIFFASPIITMPLILSATSGVTATISSLGAIISGAALGSNCFLGQFAINSASNYKKQEKLNDDDFKENQTKENTEQAKALFQMQNKSSKKSKNIENTSINNESELTL